MSSLSTFLFRKSAAVVASRQSAATATLLKAPQRVQWPAAAATSAVRLLSSSSSSSSSSEGGTANTTLIKGDGSHDDDDSSLIVSQFKNQIVHQLWTERARAKKEVGTIKPLGGQESCPSLAEHGKTPCQSETSVQYPFTSDDLLAESYRSPWNTMRLGKLFEDLDALAGNIAFYHVRNEREDGANVVHPLIVTASVDRIRLTRERTSTLQMDQILSGRVTFVGTSSMEIKMTCTGNLDNEPWLEAFFTFVTLDPATKKPIHITPLLPQNEQEQAEFDAGAKRAAIKKERRKQQKGNDHADRIQQQAQELLELARPTLLLNMPPPVATAGGISTIQMKETQLQNAMIAQPQVRNLHNRIFGGFLMRRAFELAFSNAYVFAGSRPIFQEVDEVSFKAPVDVGDLLVFNSRVLYTTTQKSGGTGNNNNYPLVHVEVEAWVTVPEQADAKLSNQFYFTFAIVGDDDDEVNDNAAAAAAPPPIQQLRQILPANIDEATRMARRMEADQQQAESDKV